MYALLADPEQNIPLEMAAFERRETGLCRSCNFAPVCAKEAFTPGNKTGSGHRSLPTKRRQSLRRREHD